MKLKRIIYTALAAVSIVGLTSCTKENPTSKNESYREYVGASSENDLDIYDSILGEFNTLYQEAKQIKDNNLRYAAMAKAEAELLYQAVFMPMSTKGGDFTLSRVAPKTSAYALWGNDPYRYKNLVIANESITSSDRQALLDAWEEKKGTIEYDSVDYAKAYLQNKGYTLSNSYTRQYTEGAKTFDYLATSLSADAEILVNIADGLVEYNGENELVGALAQPLKNGELYQKEVDSNGNAIYTFTIKDNLKWYKNDGTPSSYSITAKDFVTGFQHMLDAEGGLEYLVSGVIEGAQEYLSGKITDFSKVGVSANGNQVQYKLIGDPSYFETYLSYSIYQPLNKEFFESQGGKLGRNEFKEASSSSSYTYGKTKDNVLTCGAYYISKYADQSELVFEKNPGYWDTDMNISQIKWLYNDAKDALRGYTWYKNGQLSSITLNTTSIQQSKNDGLFEAYAHVSDTTATTYISSYNLNRQTYVLSNGGVETIKSKEQAKDTMHAMQNQSFRLAISYALNKANWNAQSVGEELQETSLRNTYTPSNFVFLNDEITVEVGNENKTYPVGTEYGQILQDYCNALGMPIDIRDGVDGWYHPQKAVEMMEIAKNELSAMGIKIDSKNKIHLDVIYYSASENQTKQANSYKASIEKVLGDYIVVDLIAASTPDDYYASGYRAASGATSNYDVFYGSGWGPDYGDPSSYLDTFLSEGAGYMTKTIGLW